MLGTLYEREAGVVSLRFGLTDGQPKTLEEIGKVYGVTRERIRQIESKTMFEAPAPVPVMRAVIVPGLVPVIAELRAAQMMRVHTTGTMRREACSLGTAK